MCQVTYQLFLAELENMSIKNTHKTPVMVGGKQYSFG